MSSDASTTVHRPLHQETVRPGVDAKLPMYKPALATALAFSLLAAWADSIIVIQCAVVYSAPRWEPTPSSTIPS